MTVKFVTAVLILTVALSCAVFAQTPSTNLPQYVRETIGLTSGGVTGRVGGLTWLRDHHWENTGHTEAAWDRVDPTAQPAYNGSVGTTGLAVIAFLENNTHLTDNNQLLCKAIQFILDNHQSDGGYYPPETYSRNYETSIAVIALIMAQRQIYCHPSDVCNWTINSADIQAAVNYITTCQCPPKYVGGFTYYCTTDSSDADMSNTATALWALDIAARAGYIVDKTVWQKALQWIISMQDGTVKGFGYAGPPVSNAYSSMTSCALMSLWAVRAHWDDTWGGYTKADIDNIAAQTEVWWNTYYSYSCNLSQTGGYSGWYAYFLSHTVLAFREWGSHPGSVGGEYVNLPAGAPLTGALSSLLPSCPTTVGPVQHLDPASYFYIDANDNDKWQCYPAWYRDIANQLIKTQIQNIAGENGTWENDGDGVPTTIWCILALSRIYPIDGTLAMTNPAPNTTISCGPEEIVFDIATSVDPLLFPTSLSKGDIVLTDPNQLTTTIPIGDPRVTLEVVNSECNKYRLIFKPGSSSCRQNLFPPGDYTIAVHLSDPCYFCSNIDGTFHFTIDQSPPFQVAFVVYSTTNAPMFMTIGRQPGASDNVGLEDAEILPYPPQPFLALYDQGSNSPHRLVTDIKDLNSSCCKRWILMDSMSMIGSTNNALRWLDGALDGKGYFYIDVPGTGYVDMNTVVPDQDGSCWVTLPPILDLESNQHLATIYHSYCKDDCIDSCTYELCAGWNMISVPFILPDKSPGVVFPGALGVFYFDNTYLAATSIEPENGYWVHYTSPVTLKFKGLRVQQWSHPMKMWSNWQLVGSVYCDDCTSGTPINQSPKLLPYGYYAECQPPNTGYHITTTLDPPRGVWIKKINLMPSATLAANCEEQWKTEQAIHDAMQTDNAVSALRGILKVWDESDQRTLQFGAAAVATDGFDVLTDTLVPPPPPFYNPDSTFDAWFEVETPESLHMACAVNAPADTLRLKLRLSGLSENVALDAGSVPLGWSVYLKTPDGHTYTLSVHDTLHLTGPQLDTLLAIKERGVFSTVLAGWNMLSRPVDGGDQLKTQCYPTAISSAYRYVAHGGYVTADTLMHGQGYWVKFPCAETTFTRGNPLYDYDTVAVAAGWNIVGSLATPLGSDSVGIDPPDMTHSQFFGYDGSGYHISNTLQPCKAYWVKVSRAGTLVFSHSPMAAARSFGQMVSTTEQPPPPPGVVTTEGPKAMPTDYALEQNHPNPFNPTTEFHYSLPFSSQVRFTIFNLLGQVIGTLVDGTESAGYKSLSWNAGPIPSGMYFYRIEAVSNEDPRANFTQTKKMILLR